MRKLIVFNHVTLDGYFVDAQGGFGWAQKGNEDAEFSGFVAENASGGGELLFGRVTYALMASYWPTPIADQHHSDVAKGMNSMAKVVFSRTLEKADWSNTRLMKGDLLDEVRRLKDEDGGGMCILGSGSIVAQLAAAGLIDEYQMVLDPVALGSGRSMFQGLPSPLSLRLVKTRVFKNGKIFLSYEPA